MTVPLEAKYGPHRQDIDAILLTNALELQGLIDKAGAQWDRGRDTVDIARTLAIHESEACYLVRRHRENRWRLP